MAGFFFGGRVDPTTGDSASMHSLFLDKMSRPGTFDGERASQRVGDL